MLIKIHSSRSSQSARVRVCVRRSVVALRRCAWARTRLRRRIYARAPTTAATHAPLDLLNTRSPLHATCDPRRRPSIPVYLSMCQCLNASEN
ncbi:unnamed protein product [Colias eurytheme]|nr:unnamed protein product [Colias eurytheme]